jgi:hypothetical protein
MVGKSHHLGVGMEDTHVLEGFMHDLISLPLLLKKGCEVVECTSDLIRIRLPSKMYDFMDFKRATDDLFYMDVIPLEANATVEQVNNTVVSDDDDTVDDNKGNNDNNGGYRGNDSNNDNVDDDDKDNSNDDNDNKKLESVDINRAHELYNHPGETKL